MDYPPAGVRSQVRIVTELLESVQECAKLFVEADENELISFDDQITSTSLLIIGRIFNSASTMKLDELIEYLNHLRVDGPEICKKMIQETSRKSPPIMHRTYLVQMLIKPRSI